MISAKSFDKALYNKLKLIITIQKHFSKLANDNLNEVGSKILFLNDITKSQSGISILAQCFKDESEFHPKNIETLADLFIFFVDKSDSSNYFHLLKKFTVSCIRKSDKVRSSFLFFLRTLLNRKVITIDLIIQEISLMHPRFTKPMKKEATKEDQIEKENSNNESNFDIENENFNRKFAELNSKRFLEKKFKVIDWFFPEIFESNPKFAIKLQNDFKYTFHNGFKTNDFSTILPIMNSGYSDEKIAQIIRKDDIDGFIQIVSQVGETFDFNQTIKSTNFERCVLLKTDPTLIQYASFFCSVKIFKFLYLNKADIKIVSKNMYTIVDFAVGGGCYEIIHILSQNGVNFLTGIPISIQFFHNDIFQWLLENHAPKSEEDFKAMNYYVCNIKNRRMYRLRYLISLNHQIDDTESDYYQQKNYTGKINDPIRKVFVRKTYPHQESSDYSDSYVIVNTNEEEEDKSDEISIDDFFRFFDFDLLFESIVNSDNYLSLFLLFDHGMNINACNEKSQKTLLHYAIQKGKSFLIDLLLSNDLIDVSLQDKNDQTPIVYSVKYAQNEVFFKMIKMQKVIDVLNDHDCIQIAFYANYLELNEINEYLKSIWSINLKYLMEINDIKNFCDAITYLPLNFLKEQIEEVLIESFKSRSFEYFSILAGRILKEKNVSICAKFYFIPKSQNKNGRERDKEFASLFQILTYYMGCFLRNSNFTDFYKLYIKNLDRKLSTRINYEITNQFVKENHFFVSSDKNVIDVFFVKDQSEIQNIEIRIQFLS